MFDYIFCYNLGERKFVERYRVLEPGQKESDVKDLAYLTGVIDKSESDALFAELQKRYPKPTYEIARSFANKWEAVENNYGGMRRHW